MIAKFALVIANTEYQDASFARLTAPGRDAEEFAQILRNPDLAAFDDVQVLLNEGEGKTRRAIARFFAERKAADLLLLYFSGHGVRSEQGQLFLAANDTEMNILEATGIPSEFITRAMNNSRSQRQLLILDCCNSGAFAQGSKSAAGVGSSMGIAHAFEGDGFGRMVLTATDATQFAFEGDKVIGDTQKSVFTHFLVEGLRGVADRNGDGRIDVDELFDYAYEQVVKRTPKQTPGKWSYKQQGDLILRDNLKPDEVAPAPLPSDLVDLLSYPNFTARKAGVQELIVLLDGKHKGLARSAKEKLREIATNDSSLDLRKFAGDALVERGFTDEKLLPTTGLDLPERTIGLPVPPISLPPDEKPERGGTVSQRKNNRLISNPILWTVIVSGLLLGTLCTWGGFNLLSNYVGPFLQPTNTSTLEPFATVTATVTSQPARTKTPSPSKTSIPTSTSIALSITPAIRSNGYVWSSSLTEPEKVDSKWVGGKTYENFSFEADVKITTPTIENHGFLFRDQANTEGYYKFTITPDGQFILWVWDGETSRSLIGPETSSFITVGEGETNRLKVIARGSNIELYINGHRVGNVKDDTWQKGWLGFVSCTCNGSSSSAATFSNLEIAIYP